MKVVFWVFTLALSITMSSTRIGVDARITPYRLWQIAQRSGTANRKQLLEVAVPSSTIVRLKQGGSYTGELIAFNSGNLQLAANGASDANLDDEQETFTRELLAQVNQGQEMKGRIRLVAQREQRIALVIGNGGYQEDPLANPVNDANDVANALEDLGFEVILLENKELRAMEEAIEDFSRELSQGGIGVFYYAGHGVQVNGENYLVPLEAELNREKDTRYEAIPLGKSR